jgi:hypothetical protein
MGRAHRTGAEHEAQTLRAEHSLAQVTFPIAGRRDVVEVDPDIEAGILEGAGEPLDERLAVATRIGDEHIGQGCPTDHPLW